MTEMLTAKDVQELLQVDRSTVYRMAETGKLPCIKVGKQWRFPADPDSRLDVNTNRCTAAILHLQRHHYNNQCRSSQTMEKP